VNGNHLVRAPPVHFSCVPLLRAVFLSMFLPYVMQQPSPPIPHARVFEGGSSCRNTRVERLWHDVRRMVRAPPPPRPLPNPGPFSWPRESPSVFNFPFFSFSSVGRGVQQPSPPSVLSEAASDGEVD